MYRTLNDIRRKCVLTYTLYLNARQGPSGGINYSDFPIIPPSICRAEHEKSISALLIAVDTKRLHSWNPTYMPILCISVHIPHWFYITFYRIFYFFF